jgi:hypothetical protein
MSGGLLFVSQSLLDAWLERERVEVSGGALTLRGREGEARRYALDPAVRFLRVAGGGEDPHRLLARVKTSAQLRAMGAEVMGGSVVLGDVAYEVEEGYLAEAAAVQAASEGGRAAPASAGGTKGGTAPRAGGEAGSGQDERRREADALARFLLDNLP